MNVYSSIFGAFEDPRGDEEPKGDSDNEVYGLSIQLWQLIPKIRNIINNYFLLSIPPSP
jgi:hypothetical protein